MNIPNLSTDVVTSVTALIGCVTGLSSLIATIVKWRTEKAKIKIEECNPLLNGFLKNDFIDLPHSDYIVVYRVNITNVRPFPCSLKKVRLLFDKVNIPIMKEDEWVKEVFNIKHPNKNILTKFSDADEYTHIHCPHLIEPMDSLNLNVVFPSADELFGIYRSNGCKPLVAKIEFTFVHKIITKKFYLIELNEQEIREAFKVYKGSTSRQSIKRRMRKRRYHSSIPE